MTVLWSIGCFFSSAREYILSLDVASIRHVVSILSENLKRLGQADERT